VKFLGDITDQLWPSRENRLVKKERQAPYGDIMPQLVKTEKERQTPYGDIMAQLVKTEKGRQAPYGDITPQPV